MGEPTRWYLVMYDIRDPKRWRKVYEVMRSYGKPLQYSIFRVHLTDRDRERLRWELAKLMDEVDSLLVLGICDSCVDRVRAINPKDAWPEVTPTFRVL